jgi:hypothetical protein
MKQQQQQNTILARAAAKQSYKSMMCIDSKLTKYRHVSRKN